MDHGNDLKKKNLELAGGPHMSPARASPLSLRLTTRRSFAGHLMKIWALTRDDLSLSPRMGLSECNVSGMVRVRFGPVCHLQVAMQ